MQKIYCIIFLFLFISFSDISAQDCSTDPTTEIPCDDGNPCTINDFEIVLDSTGQVCVPCNGQVDDCATGSTSIQPCDDNDPNTINDIWVVLNCNGTVCVPCAGTPVNCNTGTTSVVACNDFDACTINDVQTILDSDLSICIPCLGTLVDCTTGSSSIVNCDDGDTTTINDVQTELDCDGTICVPCVGTPMLLDTMNWTSYFSNTNGSVLNIGGAITIIGDTDGTGNNLDAIDCNAIDGNVSYCITMPSAKDITFDWSTPDGTSFNPLVERFGYCVNGMVTELTSVNPSPFGTSSGTATVTVSANDQLCFIAASKFSDGTTPTIYTINNFIVTAAPDLVTASIAATPNTLACFGDTNGSILVTPSGGSGGFSYIWDNATATGNNPMNLAAGTYCVTVTDASGNSFEACTTITQPTELIGNAAIDSNVKCNGGIDGQATANQNGGTVGYNYAWDNLETTVTAINLSVGTHTVTITDANGCEATASVDLTEPDALTIALSSTAELGMNGDGTATATLGGGTPTYSYSWNTFPVQTTPSAVGLTSGTYSVTVTDANDCEIIESIVVDQMTNLEDFSAIKHFNIFPNPTKGKVNLEIDFNQKLDVTIQLVNSIGQEIITMHLQNVNAVNQSFNWEKLPKGIYWLSVSSNDKRLVQKILIE